MINLLYCVDTDHDKMSMINGSKLFYVAKREKEVIASISLHGDVYLIATVEITSEEMEDMRRFANAVRKD